VLARIKGSEQVTVATGLAGEVPFGLLANFVGGDFDEGFSGDSLQNSVGVWRGPDAVFEVLAPAFGTVTMSDGISAGTTVTDVNNSTNLLYAGADGRLTTSQVTAGQYTAGASYSAPVARLIEKVGSSRIVVELLV
jgi:hypothetical protein